MYVQGTFRHTLGNRDSTKLDMQTIVVYIYALNNPLKHGANLGLSIKKDINVNSLMIHMPL